MCGHYLQQLSIAQVFVGDVLFVGGFFHADDILRPQPCLSQQRLQLGYRQRLLEVVTVSNSTPCPVRTRLTSRQVLQVGFS